MIPVKTAWRNRAKIIKWIIVCLGLVATLGLIKHQLQTARGYSDVKQFLELYASACEQTSLARLGTQAQSRELCDCLPAYPGYLHKEDSTGDSEILRFRTAENELRHERLSKLVDGAWRPKNCQPRSLLAIIIPYRNREVHLRKLLNYLHPFLQSQNMAYQIFVIEQSAPIIFNRASLMNVGFKEAMARSPFDCFIFHDVDLLPEDGRNLYSCLFSPVHLGAYMNKFDYRLPYSTFFGGAIALTRHQVEKMNGFSNSYYGWGGEDDDSYIRLQRNNFTVFRYPKVIGKSYMIQHERDSGNPPNAKRDLAYNATMHAYETDGLNSLQYSVLSSRNHGLYTLISVSIEREKQTSCIVDASLPATQPNNYVECLDNEDNFKTGKLDCCRSGDLKKVYCCQKFPLSVSGEELHPFRRTVVRVVLPCFGVSLIIVIVVKKRLAKLIISSL